ncbi:MAG: hypothetical protein DRG87_01820 [Deltaproteobacteria bacterium]|nr:MAG: hypothetical protein DRG87_01820 [Deltaproteobacteria bacterium]
MCKVVVEPGICGFKAEVEVKRENSKKVHVYIKSECLQVMELNEMLHTLGLKDIFVPPRENIIFACSEKAGCHASCPIPLAILKCAEIEMGLALPKEVLIAFES